MQAKNDAQLKAMIIPDLRRAAQYLAEKIMKMNDVMLEDIVYSAYDPVEYERTMGLKEAWRAESYGSVSRSTATAHFSYDPSKLKAGNIGQHSSIVSGEPISSYLAEIIFEGLAGGIYQEGYAKNNPQFSGEAWTKKRDAWTALEKWLGKKNFKELLDESLTKAGIPYHSHLTEIRLVKSK